MRRLLVKRLIDKGHQMLATRHSVCLKLVEWDALRLFTSGKKPQSSQSSFAHLASEHEWLECRQSFMSRLVQTWACSMMLEYCTEPRKILLDRRLAKLERLPRYSLITLRYVEAGYYLGLTIAQGIMETSFLRDKKGNLDTKHYTGHGEVAVLSWYFSLELILCQVIVANWTDERRPSWPLRMCRWYHVYHVHLQSTYSAQKDSSKWLWSDWTATYRNYSVEPCRVRFCRVLFRVQYWIRHCLFGVYATTNFTSDLLHLDITISPDPAEQNRDQISIGTSPLIDSISYGAWRSEWFDHHLSAIIAVSRVYHERMEVGIWHSMCTRGSLSKYLPATVCPWNPLSVNHEPTLPHGRCQDGFWSMLENWCCRTCNQTHPARV